MALALWLACLQRLKEEISQSTFNQWISPLQAEETQNGLILWAPNQYVLDGVSQNYIGMIANYLSELNHGTPLQVIISVGEKKTSVPKIQEESGAQAPSIAAPIVQHKPLHQSNLNPHFTFIILWWANPISLAEAAAKQVAENPGGAYNPLFLYGGVGLGKTHLTHAIGNAIQQRKNGRNVIYLHSERFVADMVKALQSNTINEFKRFYRSVDALID